MAPLALGWMVLAGGCLLEEAPPTTGGPVQACADDSDCAEGLTCVDGQCQDQTKPPVTPDCTSDADCAAGQVCSTTYGDCLSMCDGMQGMACPAVCAGVCMDPKPPVECWGDADCAADEYCSMPVCAAAGAPAEYDGSEDAAMPYPCDPAPGVCMKKETPPTGCQTDADCGADEFCSFPACGGGTPVPMDGSSEAPSGSFAPIPERCPPPTEGVCMPKEQPQDLCMSDDDCGPGTHCNAGDVCLPGPQPPCPDGEACPAIAVCYGECVADQQGECQTDADCGPGMACEPQEICPSCAACEPYDESGSGDFMECPPCPPCEVYNQCVPVEPPPSECDSDADCGPGMICQAVENCWDDCGGYYPADGDGDPSGAPAQDCGGPCEVSYQCMPAPETFCDTYTPCPDGMVCAYDMCEGCICTDGEPCDCDEYCSGSCQAVEPPPAECLTDADCADGQFCWTEQCEPCECAPGEDCACTGECWGICQDLPDPGYCTSDADCGYGYHCENQCTGFADPAGSGGAAMPCPPPQCVPDDPTPEFCQSDADCADGYHCEDMCGGWYGPDGSGAIPPIACPPPQCVPNDPGPVYCKSDEECPAGQQCAEPLEDGFPPGVMVCQDVVEPPPAQCMVTGCSGQICADHDVMTTCEWTPAYACFEYAECGNFGPDGACGWQMTDAFAECMAQFQ